MSKRIKIDKSVFLPLCLTWRQRLKSDPEQWSIYEIESLRGACGPAWGHVPTDDVRVQACNLRKSGELGKIRENGHGQTKTPEHSKEYKEYIKSERWKVFAKKVIEWWGGRCALCYGTRKLQVHHRTYERLGHELMTDCVCLCSKCHKVADARRKREGISVFDGDVTDSELEKAIGDYIVEKPVSGKSLVGVGA